MSAKKRVLIACGGTGGHLFPGISVGEVLKKRGHEVLLLISEKGIDAVVSEGHQELDYRTMDTMGMGRLISLRTLKFIFSTWKACRKSRGMVDEFGVASCMPTPASVSSQILLRSKTTSECCSPQKLPVYRAV
ncbi:MAG: glycosyltransferase [Verrucomicrobiota bacterium]